MVHRGSVIWKMICLILAAAQIFMVCGCYYTTQSAKKPLELTHPNGEKIVQIVLNNGKPIEFNKEGGIYIERTRDGRLRASVVGITKGGAPVDIDIKNIQEVRIEKRVMEGTKTFTLVSIGALVVLIAIACVSFVTGFRN